MNSESSLLADAASQLRAAGFFVEREVTFGTRGVAADLVAWAPDESGELIRDVVVEAKRGRFDQSSLAQLSRIASIAGARRAFVFTGEWLAVDPAFSETRPSPPPRPLHRPDRVRVPYALLEDTLRRAMWKSHDAARNSGGEVRNDARSIGALVSQLNSAPGSADWANLARAPGTALSVARILASIPEEVGLPLELTSCLARLLQPSDQMAVLDPFCGLGGCLWAVADEAQQRRASVELFGWERNEDAATVIRQLAAFAHQELSVEAFEVPPSLDGQLQLAPAEVPSRPIFDAVISVLPFNAKGPRTYNLATGDQTPFIDLAVLDAVGDWLKPGGRAVLVAAPRLLFAEGDAARVRARLACTMRVVSVVELPGGVLKNTKIQCGIVVLEKSAPGETLVARLTDDWKEQLSATGEFFRTYIAHLMRTTTP